MHSDNPENDEKTKREEAALRKNMQADPAHSWPRTTRHGGRLFAAKNLCNLFDRVPTACCRGDAELFLDDCIRVKTTVLHSPPEAEHSGSDDV